MQYFKIIMVLCSLVAIGAVVKAQDTAVQVITNAVDKPKDVQVAFRKVEQSDLLGGVSAVNVAELLQKNYFIYGLDGMEAWAPGYNGNSNWGMGGYLVLIDGVPREVGNVSPTEIDQITFLKGVNAVALYGSRAAKGVIYITTKRGEANNFRIDIRANAGANVPKRYPLYLGSAEYMILYNEARRNDGLAELYSQETIYNYASGRNPYRYPNVDYYSSDYLKKMYGRYDATAEISGGNDKARYYTNIGFQTAGSLLNFGEAIRNNRADRFNVRGNIDITLSNYISCNVDASGIFYTGHGVNTNYWGSAATLRPHRFSPLIPLSMIEAEDEVSQVLVKNSNHLIDGQYLLGGTQLDQTNPFAAIYAGGNNQFNSRQFQFNTGVNADLRNVLKGLSFRSTFAVDYTSSYNLAYNNSYAVYAPTWNNYNGEDLISDLTKYGQDATPGVQNVSNTWYRQTISATGQFNYVNSIKSRHNLSAILLVNGFQQSESAVYHRTSNANLGLQLGYNYLNKYYLDFSGAMIHSAKLPEGNRQAFSPTVSLGWRISSEPFMSGATVIDNLRLTASAGILHTDLDITTYYLYQGYYTGQGSWFGWKDGTGIQATEARRGDNPNMKFPKREEISIGLEGSFFKKLVTLQGTFFVNKITGNIIQPAVLYPSYFTTGWPVSSFIPFVNYNDDKRVGVDFSANLNKKLGGVDWSLGVAGTYYKTTAAKRAEVYEDDYQYRAGKPLDAVWGLQSLGFFSDQNDINNSPSQTFGQVKPGDIKYKDQNGDGIINARDEVYLGRGGWFGAPLTLGINLTAKWKNLTFFALGVGRFGAYAMKNNSYFWVDGDDKYSIMVRDRWTTETQNTAKYPRLTTFNSDNNFRASDFWLYKTNRFDLSKVQISYDITGMLKNKKLVKDLGVYISGFNLLTISPEREIMELNIESAPQTRLYNVGVKALF
ncbi:SusC/RagA family TonB-linked outer membrane protein [Niastella caeni]|uniref:SusC/RagA family TonB-linked outer membrane protein n=1 Tax=Niastella caeni TaxID=2569763 RepID=A0A4S8I0J3_9BACT|nr:SusC/RagA family TonB-linked outer membrane protein [Niastella caeni]THU41201.1 SusC/RagA family TonB-linked outer membrane protein [Niastella caeni]